MENLKKVLLSIIVIITMVFGFSFVIKAEGLNLEDEFKKEIKNFYGDELVLKKGEDDKFLLPENSKFVWNLESSEKGLYINSKTLDIQWGYLTKNETFSVTVSGSINDKKYASEILIKLLIKEKDYLTISDAKSKKDGSDVLKVRGVLTAISTPKDMNDFYAIKNIIATFQDENDAIYIFGIDKMQAMFTNLQIGNTYEISGMKNSYQNVSQLQEVYELNLVSDDKKINIKPIKLTETKDVNINDNYKLVEAVGYFKNIPTEILEKQNYEFILKSGEKINLRTIGSENTGFQTFIDIKNKLQDISPNQEVKITAPITFFNGTPQIQLYNEEQIKIMDASDYSDEELLNLALNLPKIPISIHDNENLVFPNAFFDTVNISYKSSHENIINNEGIVNLDNVLGRQIVKITVTASINDNVKTKEYEVIVGDYLKLKDIRNLEDETEILAKGIVTQIHYNSRYNNADLYLQDDSAAISLFRVPKAQLSNIRIGSEIEVKGIKTTFNGHIQLKDITSLTRLNKSVELPAPIIVETIKDLENNPAKLVEINFTLINDLTSLKTLNDKGYYSGNIIEVLLNDGSKTKFKLPNPNEVDEMDYLFLERKLLNLKKGSQVKVLTNVSWYNNPQFEIYQSDQILDITKKEVNQELYDNANSIIIEIEKYLETLKVIKNKDEAVENDIYILKKDYDKYVDLLSEIKQELKSEDLTDESLKNIIEKLNIKDEIVEKTFVKEQIIEQEKPSNTKSKKTLIITIIIFASLIVISSIGLFIIQKKK